MPVLVSYLVPRHGQVWWQWGTSTSTTGPTWEVISERGHVLTWFAELSPGKRGSAPTLAISTHHRPVTSH